METELNKGHAKACLNPKCKKLVFSKAHLGNFFGLLDWEFKCPYCGTLMRAKIIQKVSIVIELVGVVAIVFLAHSYVEARKINCGVFQSRIDAQKAFNSEPYRLRRLDADHDGKVCEKYPYKQVK